MKNVIKVLALSLVMVMTLGLLVSCGGPNKDPDKAEDALKDAGYTVTNDDTVAPGIYKLAGVDGVECVVTGVNAEEDEEGFITIIYFEETEDAKEAWEDIQDEAEEEKDDNEDWVCKKSGKIIYYGTKNAVKAAK